MSDLVNYNVVPEAPKQPYGPAYTAVGGNAPMDVQEFIKQYLQSTNVPGLNPVAP